MMQEYDLVVVGGGISGLATAYYARNYWGNRGSANKGSANKGSVKNEASPLRIRVFEAGNRLGGKVQTEHVDVGADAPFVVEAGPDSFLTQKPWALELARELGLGDALMGTNDRRRKVYVLQGRKLVQMPEGLQLIVPTRLAPFVTSPLISPWGKLRMALDLVLPARRDGADETLADFVTRRLGQEALDKLAEPLMSGIYSAEADRQSILATFPRFREMERQHGSLLRAMWASAAQRKQAAARRSNDNTAGTRTSAFMTPIEGTATLVERLAEELAGITQTGTTVKRLEPGANAAGPGYYLTLENDARVFARAVVLAVPAGVAANLLGDAAPRSAAQLRTIRYVSTVTLSLAYAPDAVKHPMDGFGVMIPRGERRPINALTWTTRKFDNRAPAGHHLMRVFLGGARNPEILESDDAELVTIAREQLQSIMGVEADPLFHRLFRWDNASPQYDVGHLERVAAIEAGLPAGLFVTGSPYRGIGIPDCVHQAQNTAQQFVQALRAATSANATTAESSLTESAPTP